MPGDEAAVEIAGVVGTGVVEIAGVAGTVGVVGTAAVALVWQWRRWRRLHTLDCMLECGHCYHRPSWWRKGARVVLHTLRASCYYGQQMMNGIVVGGGGCAYIFLMLMRVDYLVLRS